MEDNLDGTLAERIDSAALRELYRYWASQRGERKMPRRRDIDPTSIPRLLPNIAIIEVRGEPGDYVLRLTGTEVDRQNGAALTGLTLRTVTETTTVKVDLSEYALVARRGEARVSRGNLVHRGREHVDFERLLLPLSEDGVTVNQILAMFDYRTRSPQAEEPDFS